MEELTTLFINRVWHGSSSKAMTPAVEPQRQHDKLIYTNVLKKIRVLT